VAADINERDTYGSTPAHLAAQNGNTEVLKYLLREREARLDMRNSEERSVMHYCKQGSDLAKVGTA